MSGSDFTMQRQRTGEGLEGKEAQHVLAGKRPEKPGIIFPELDFFKFLCSPLFSFVPYFTLITEDYSGTMTI